MPWRGNAQNTGGLPWGVPNHLAVANREACQSIPERAYPTRPSALEATQGQMDGFFSQLPYKCHLEEVASVGD